MVYFKSIFLVNFFMTDIDFLLNIEDAKNGVPIGPRVILKIVKVN
jgi:hypothetical protein